MIEAGSLHKTFSRLSQILNATYYLCWDDACSDIDYNYKGIPTKYEDKTKIPKNIFININELKYDN